MFKDLKNIFRLGDIPEPSADLIATRAAFRRGLIDMDELRDRLANSSLICSHKVEDNDSRS